MVLHQFTHLFVDDNKHFSPRNTAFDLRFSVFMSGCGRIEVYGAKMPVILNWRLSSIMPSG